MTEPMPRKLSYYFSSSKRKGRAGLPTMSVTTHNGLVRRDLLDRKMDSALEDDEHLLIEPGDIAYNMMRMWQGALGLADEPANVSPAYGVMRPKPTVDPRFAAHWFKSARGLYMLWAFSYGLTDDRLRLYPKEFLQIPVVWPELPEQRRIAAVLDAWDDAIASCEKLVAAKERESCGLMHHLVGDCHNPFQQKGKLLGDIASVLYGKAVDPDQYAKNAPNWVLGTQGIIGSSTSADFNGEAIVVGRKGTLNNPIYVPAGQGFRSIDTTFVLLPKKECKALFYYFRHINLAKLNEASGVPSISSDTLKSLPIPIFPERLAALMSAHDELLGQFRNHLLHLRQQKRGLMQKLLTGESQVLERVNTLLSGSFEVTA
jgi:type I restriction enzyme S subunit